MAEPLVDLDVNAGRGGSRGSPRNEADEEKSSGASKDNKKLVVFNACKREQFHGNSGFKKLMRRLRSMYKVTTNKEDLSKDTEADLIVFGGPREKFTAAEIEEVKAYVKKGGSALFFVNEGGEEALRTNLNELLEEYGVSVNMDSVVRTVYYKYLHPKEVFIANGILQPSIALSKNLTSKANKSSKAAITGAPVDTSNNGGLNFVFPYGATMNVQRPALAVLSSGPISYPLNRPIAAVYRSPDITTDPDGDPNVASPSRQRGRHGRVMVISSCKLFSDEWIDKEENMKLGEVLFRWLLQEKDAPLLEDRKDADLSDNMRIPNTKALAESMRSCLQEHDVRYPPDSSVYTRVLDRGLEHDHGSSSPP